ncbi:MAG: thioredoxin [Chloroflexota bacterium]|nr:thioredoxin [Chloroflexota bacterium]
MLSSVTGEDKFQNNILKSGIPVLVDFWANWCSPCLAAEPMLEELSREYRGRAKFTKVNVEENTSIAARYGVSSLPSMLIFKNGQPVRQIVGLKTKAGIRKTLDSVL